VKFDGTFTIQDVTAAEVWLALSDPYMIKQSLPGCQYLVAVDDPDTVDFEALHDEIATEEDPPTLPDADPGVIPDRAFEQGGHYVAMLQLSVGNVSPSFETEITIEEREFPKMRASGTGSANQSSFEMGSEMKLVEHDAGVDIEWEAEADVFGKVAGMGQRVINPVANRVVGRFFGSVEDRLVEVAEDESAGLRDRIRNLK